MHGDGYAAGRPLGEVIEADGALVIAVRNPAGHYETKPPRTRTLAADDVLVVLASNDELQRVRAAVGRRPRIQFRGAFADGD